MSASRRLLAQVRKVRLEPGNQLRVTRGGGCIALAARWISRR
jgi:hypothetical protein